MCTMASVLIVACDYDLGFVLFSKSLLQTKKEALVLCKPLSNFFPGTWVCDGGQTVLSLIDVCQGNQSYCEDRSDDSLCKCLSHQWKCKTDDLCVPKDELCDAYNDCDDESDEDPAYCEKWAKCTSPDDNKFISKPQYIKHEGIVLGTTQFFFIQISK